MKSLIVVSLLFTTFVQAETEQKRPSWSQGLPEREQSISTNNPSFRVESTTQKTVVQAPDREQVLTTAPTIDLEPFEAPNLAFNLNDLPVESAKLNTGNTATNQLENRLSYRSGLGSKKRFQDLRESDDIKNPLHDEYKWQILKTTPISIPSHLGKTTSINVDIYLKPDGSVSRVSSIDPKVTSHVLKLVNESMENWQFEAPEKIGITDIVTKNFVIEIES